MRHEHDPGLYAMYMFLVIIVVGTIGMTIELIHHIYALKW